MAGKLIPLEEAAKMLGISVEELTEYNARNEILDVRGTGPQKKFKLEELQRFADEKGLVLSVPGEDDSSDLLGADSSPLAEDDDLLESSELVLDIEDEESGELSLAENTGSDVLASDDSKIGESGSDTGKMGNGDDELLLAEDDLFEDGDLSLSDDGDISLDSDSDLEDSDLVLDEDSSSEIALSAEDSGINLSPTDSGLSLEEESIELDGSDIDALELPEDDDMIAVEGEMADSDSATQLKADDDFMLTPVEESMDDESSGSQVIDLESSEIYVDDSSGGIFGSESDEEVSSAALVAEDAEMFQPEVEGLGMGAQPVGAPVMVQQTPEAPYSIFNILSLMMVLFFVTVAGMITFDVTRNMWNFTESGTLSSTLMDMVIQMVGLTP